MNPATTLSGHKMTPVSLSALNNLDQADFEARCGSFFEHSPWIAQAAWSSRPFRSRAHLLQIMSRIVSDASDDEKLALVRAHPDLVGRFVREGKLTNESAAEQAEAGLAELSPGEAQTFDRFNSLYQSRFGFPFVICARENRKDAILAAFPQRLQNDFHQEMGNALAEIFKIARLRIGDAISEDGT